MTVSALRVLTHKPPKVFQLSRRPRNCAQCCRPKRHDKLWLNQGYFLPQPGLTRLNMLCARRLVNAPPAPRGESKMLYSIRHVEGLGFNARLRHTLL